MNKFIVLSAACLSGVFVAPSAQAEDLFEALFGAQEPIAASHSRSARHARSARLHSGVSEMIASAVAQRLGEGWVATALQIARIESGGNCGAINRSGATGVFQVVNPQRFGVSRAYARTCEGGIAAGVAHMEACLAKGARTSSQMLRCHNSGSPFGRVERAYRKFL